MHRLRKIFAFLAILFLLLFPPYGVHVVQAKEKLPQDRILLKFNDSSPITKRNELLRVLGTKVEQHLEKLDVEVVNVSPDKLQKLLETLQLNPLVDYAEPDYVASALETTNDPSLPSQWGLFKIQAAGSATSAWDITHGSTSIKVAILDTGIDQDHPDLIGKVDINQKNCTATTDFDDHYGHGTHVAGIVAATTNNNLGVAGVGYNTTLMNYKSLGDSGSGYYSWIATCIIAAADDGAKVINMSLGGPSKSTTLENAINYAWNRGVVLAAAAGNSGNSSPTYPAYYSNVIAVAATDQNDKKASFSSYGKWVDVAAPGVSILSTFPNHANTLGKLNYDYADGTSMSTPYVAGLAALLWATPYGTTNTSVRGRIENQSDKISGTGNYWYWGRINACRAVGCNPATPTPTNTPTPTLTPTPTRTPTTTPKPTPTPTHIPAATSEPTPTPKPWWCQYIPTDPRCQ